MSVFHEQQFARNILYVKEIHGSSS
jgi:hypothetical protein